MQNNELIFLGANIKAQNILNVDEEYFTDQELKQFVIESKRMLKDSKSDPGLQKQLDKISTNALIEFENFCKDKSVDEIKKGLIQISDILEENTEWHKSVYIDLFDERLAVKTEEQYVTTGITPLDYYLTGGLMKKTLVGIQAATGKGKTTMLMTIGCNMLLQGFNVCFVNLEMNENEFNNNILSGISDKFSYADIKSNNNLDNKEFRESLRQEIMSKNVGKSTMLVNADLQMMNTQKLEKLLLKTERKLNIKFDAILVDYLFLLKAAGNDIKNIREDSVLQKITQECHIMSQRNNWAILSVFQENRYGAKDTQNSGFEGMAGSFNSLHDMDNYFKFHQDTDRDNLIIVKPLKLRQFGAFGKNAAFTMEYSFQKKIYVLSNELATNVNEYKWKQIFDLPEIHDNLNSKDIFDLMKNLNIQDLPETWSVQFSKYRKKKGYKCVENSTIDWKTLNIENIILKNQRVPKTYNTVDLTDPQKLFEM